MKNFILTFGKYKGFNFYETPQSYQNWLLETNFKINQNEIDSLIKCNFIGFNYRTTKSVISSRTGVNGSCVNFKKTYKYISIEGKYISQTKSHLIIERLVDGNLVKQRWNKNNITNFNN